MPTPVSHGEELEDSITVEPAGPQVAKPEGWQSSGFLAATNVIWRLDEPEKLVAVYDPRRRYRMTPTTSAVVTDPDPNYQLETRDGYPEFMRGWTILHYLAARVAEDKLRLDRTGPIPGGHEYVEMLAGLGCDHHLKDARGRKAATFDPQGKIPALHLDAPACRTLGRW